MNKISLFFGWLFATDAYMATLTDEQIAIRALGKKGAYKLEAQRRESEAAHQRLIEAIERWQHGAPVRITYTDEA